VQAEGNRRLATNLLRQWVKLCDARHESVSHSRTEELRLTNGRCVAWRANQYGRTVDVESVIFITVCGPAGSHRAPNGC
jgi:hypothetical protein